MKKPCKYKKSISVFVDGQLSKIEAEQIQRHLGFCPECLQLYQEYQQLNDLITDLPTIEMSDDFDFRFEAKLKNINSRSLWSRYVKPFFIGWQPILAAATAACLVAGIIIYSNQETVTPSSEEIIMVQNIDFFQNFEIIRQLELLETWEAIKTESDNS